MFNLVFLQSFSYIFGLILIIAEILLGFTLILGYRAKLTLRLLLLFTIFFGFLTFYSAYFNKVTDCGCFGDAIKFTPWESFMKDLVLFIMIIPILLMVKDIKPLIKNNSNKFINCIISFYYIYFYSKIYFLIITYKGL